MARVGFLSYLSRSDSREHYSPPGRRSLLESLSVPDLGFAFAGGAVGRVLRFALMRRCCMMATIRVTRRRARNATRSLGVRVGFISRGENGLGFAHKSRSSLLSVAGLVSRHDGVGCCCYKWRGDRIFHQRRKPNSGDVQEHLVSVCCRGGVLLITHMILVSVSVTATAVVDGRSPRHSPDDIMRQCQKRHRCRSRLRPGRATTSKPPNDNAVLTLSVHSLVRPFCYVHPL